MKRIYKYKFPLLKKNLVESFLSLSVLNGLNVLLPLVTLPYILRVVGAANYGIYAYIYVLIQYLLLFSAYGFNLSATKQIAQHRDDKHLINRIYNSVVACRLLLFVAGLMLFAALSPLILDTVTKKLMFIMGLGIVLGDTLNPVWLFQGMEKMRYMTVVNLVSKTVFTILIFVVVRAKDDFIYILLLNSLGFLVAGFLSSIIAKKQFGIKFYLPKFADIKFQFRDGFALFGSNIGINLYSNVNVFILKFFVSDAAVGIYAAAEKIIKGLQSLTLPVMQALFPYLGKDFYGQTINYQINKINKIARTLSIVFIVPNILVFLCAGIIVHLFCGNEFDSSILLVKIMSPVIIVGMLNYTLGIVGFVNMNKQKIFFYGVLISGLISVVFLLLTISYWGIISASIAMLLSEVVLFILLVINLRKLKNAYV